MKKLIARCTLPLVFIGTAALADGHMEAGKAKFEAVCADCHYNDDFAGTPRDEIKGMIEAVAAGEVEHDEDISGLTEEEIGALAAYLASAE